MKGKRSRDAQLGPQGEKALEAFKQRARDAEARLRVVTVEAEAEAERLRAENARMKAAMLAGLDPDLADRIHGTTPDEMLEDAKRFAGAMMRGQRTGAGSG